MGYTVAATDRKMLVPAMARNSCEGGIIVSLGKITMSVLDRKGGAGAAIARDAIA